MTDTRFIAYGAALAVALAWTEWRRGSGPVSRGLGAAGVIIAVGLVLPLIIHYVLLATLTD